MALTCCEFTGPAVVGDAAAVIVVHSGSPNEVDGLAIYAEGCDNPGSNCAYEDAYNDTYCDVTEGGLYPNATITDFMFTINNMPPNSILTIDAADHTVTLTDETGMLALGQLETLDWNGLFEWIEAAKSGCQRICFDTGGATVNGDTTVEVVTYDREL